MLSEALLAMSPHGKVDGHCMSYSAHSTSGALLPCFSCHGTIFVAHPMQPNIYCISRECIHHRGHRHPHQGMLDNLQGAPAHIHIEWEDITYVADLIFDATKRPNPPLHHKDAHPILNANRGVARRLEQHLNGPGRHSVRSCRLWLARELTKTLNGMLGGADPWSRGAPLKNSEAVCKSMHCLGRGCRWQEQAVSVTPEGYCYIRLGKATLKGQSDRLSVACHRLACWLAHGDPPAGSPNACHACGRRACCRPACLRWDSTAANTQEAARQNGEWCVLAHLQEAPLVASVVRRAGHAFCGTWSEMLPNGHVGVCSHGVHHALQLFCGGSSGLEGGLHANMGGCGSHF